MANTGDYHGEYLPTYVVDPSVPLEPVDPLRPADEPPRADYWPDYSVDYLAPPRGPLDA